MKNFKTWIEINRKAIRHNFDVLKSLIQTKCKFMAVIKSNAYGHDIGQFAKEMAKLVAEGPEQSRGVDFFGVDDFDEAILIRKFGLKTPILVFGYIPFNNLQKAVDQKISLTVSNMEFLSQISRSNLRGKLKIHLKADTGLHRQGFKASQLSEVLEMIKRSKNFALEGIYTHFAAIENPKFINYSKKQAGELKIWRDKLRQAGFKPITHASSTAGIIFSNLSRRNDAKAEDFHFDMVRAGIGMYGLWPSPEIKILGQSKINLKPVLSWHTIVSEIKNIQKGSRVGYDLTEAVKKDSKIAICPVGYWHGYPRALSSKASVLIRGERAKVLGRVSMDMIVVDVTQIKGAKRGDKVTLIGRDGKNIVSMEELANITGTINYEIVTRINSQIPRIYI